MGVSLVMGSGGNLSRGGEVDSGGGVGWRGGEILKWSGIGGDAEPVLKSGNNTVVN